MLRSGQILFSGETPLKQCRSLPLFASLLFVCFVWINFKCFHYNFGLPLSYFYWFWGWFYLNVSLAIYVIFVFMGALLFLDIFGYIAFVFWWMFYSSQLCLFKISLMHLMIHFKKKINLFSDFMCLFNILCSLIFILYWFWFTIIIYLVVEITFLIWFQVGLP